MKTFDMQDQPQASDFSAVQLRVASPDAILSWSHGEVLKPETINYRTQKPERDGLFCERIFGPTQDYKCYCGKYKSIRYKGVICDKCGVEVTKSFVRRVRMGHIDLAVPVAHTWYLQGIPSVLSLLLDIPVSDLERITYFAAYVILSVDEDVRKSAIEQLDEEFADLKKELLDGKQPGEVDGTALMKFQAVEAEYKAARSELSELRSGLVVSEYAYHDLSLKFGGLMRVGIGAEAIRELLKKINLTEGIEQLKNDSQSNSIVTRRKSTRRLKLFNDLQKAGIDPEYFVLTRLPVIPPDLRPMVQLDGGRFAASDLNDLYRRVLNRNNRLKKLLNSGAPEVITRNEKRMLQEAVDALIDNNARRGKAAAAATGLKRKLKSLSDMLRGKHGRFRQNLLGKRVDYSGRSVIVVGPNLKLHQCGLPKIMALELFKPFVVGRLITGGYVHNVKNATRLIEQGDALVWDILEDLTKDHFVLLNRAPTLHRLGIQAFQPVLIEGKAIQIHPLVCTAYNADFDGDQMAVHVPLSKLAQEEASTIMRSSKNLLKPASGEVIVSPTKDMILGTYYVTVVEKEGHGAGRAFASPDEAIMAHDQGIVGLRAEVKVRVNEEIFVTSVGQLYFNQIVPDELGYQTGVMDKKGLTKLIANCFQVIGSDRTAAFVDDVKDLGFRFAEKSGVTFSLSDIVTPDNKKEVMAETDAQLAEIEKQYRRGLITRDEMYVKTVELWMEAGRVLEKEVLKGFVDSNPIMSIFRSGARGTLTNLNQIAGMKGLVASPTGAIIEIPLKNNFKNGLSVFEYFLSTHGSRKGRTDTALRTSDAGYLTRRLVDVAQDVVVSEEDCHSDEGVLLYKKDELAVADRFEEALLGRFTIGEQAGVASGTLITEEIASKLAVLDEVVVRSPLYCKCQWGICQTCYGQNLATGRIVDQGEAVGIIAAQAIGEPGTQLTMKTFHMGGVAQAGGDITAGLPRVEELFEARSPKTPAIMSEISGRVTIEDQGDTTVITVTSQEPDRQVVKLPKGFTAVVKTGDTIAPRDIIAETPGKTLRSVLMGTVNVSEGEIVVTATEKATREYTVSRSESLVIQDGQMIEKGSALTEGHIDLQQLLALVGRRGVERYVVHEVQKIYSSQGQTIHNKHIEIIVRQMLSKVTVTEGGESDFVTGQTIDLSDYRLTKELGKRMDAEQQLLGITWVSLRTKSFLSAASFQQTTGVLIDAAVQGKRDSLRGLKENVIIGKLIPAGTGYQSDQVSSDN